MVEFKQNLRNDLFEKNQHPSTLMLQTEANRNDTTIEMYHENCDHIYGTEWMNP